MNGLPFSVRFPIGIKRNSFQTKLFVSYLLLTVLGTTLMAGYLLWTFHDYYMKTRQADLENWTDALSESVADSLAEANTDRVRILVDRYGAPETVTLRVFTPDGQLLASSSSEDKQIINWLIVPGIQEALHYQTTRGVSKGVLSNDDRLYIARPVLLKGKLLGVLRMSITLKQFQRQFIVLVWTVLGALLLTVFLCALISDRFARGLAKPIQLMRNFAIRLGTGHFGDRLKIRQSNELDQLAIELNRMSERLASLDQERRSFLANVSHELRTPISNVQVTVEALRSGAVDEPELRDRFFQTIDDETRRLAQLIHDLLDLGRLEAGATLLERQVISLSQLIDRATRAIEPRMKTKEISLQSRISELQIKGDPERLLQALLNILDNAFKHTKVRSTIFIAGYREGNQAIITIQDQGAGIDQKALPHIFEQFYTGDPSRKGNGTGLGLAIAQRIVAAHGGIITASSEPGKGATFTIRLPIGES